MNVLLVAVSFCLIAVVQVQATIGFVPPVQRTTGQNCIQDGETVSYECTVNDVMGVATTVWLGSAFDCPSGTSAANNRMTLSHGSFDPPPGVMAECGDQLSATSGAVNGTEYTSTLTLMATTALDGETINCTVSEVILVGSDTVVIRAPTDPPQMPMVSFTSSSSLTVTWMPPMDDSNNVASYMITLVSGDCGVCTQQERSITCTDWSAIGQTCSFEASTLSADCGFMSNVSNFDVSLTRPSSPSGLSVTPIYNIDGTTQLVDVAFNGVDAPLVAPGIDTVDYIVTIGSLMINFTGASCNASNHCSLTVGGSRIIDRGMPRVVAINAVGRSAPYNLTAPVIANTVTEGIVSIEIIAANRTVLCNLLGSFPVTPNFVCSITYGPPENPEQYTDSSSPINGQPNTPVTFSLTNDLDDMISYNYTLTVPVTGITTITFQGNFRSICPPSELSQVGTPSSPDASGMVTVPNGVVRYDGVTVGSIARLTCDDGSEGPTRTCTGIGSWSGELQACAPIPDPFPWWIIVVIVLVVAFLSGVLTGCLCSVLCKLFSKGLSEGKCIYIVLVIILIFAFGFGIGVLIGYCCCGRKKKSKDDTVELDSRNERKSPPANPNEIEHEAAPGTDDQYALVDTKNRKSKAPKPTQPEALYQDPNAIEHETAPSGDTYAVVDKPKRGSSKKKEPDVVPGPSLTYADIDVSGRRNRPNPASQRQAQQPVGHVEYSDINYKAEENVAQL